jgi:hypothetical protein
MLSSQFLFYLLGDVTSINKLIFSDKESKFWRSLKCHTRPHRWKVEGDLNSALFNSKTTMSLFVQMWPVSHLQQSPWKICLQCRPLGSIPRKNQNLGSGTVDSHAKLEKHWSGGRSTEALMGFLVTVDMTNSLLALVCAKQGSQCIMGLTHHPLSAF